MRTGRLQRRAVHHRPGGRAEVRVGGRAGREQLADLALDIGRRLAGQRAPLDRQPASFGDRRRPLPSFDHTGVHGAGAEERVRACRETSAEGLDLDQQRSGPDDRVDTELRSGTVRRDPHDVDLGPHESLVRHADGHLGGLRDDGRVGDESGAEMVQNPLDAKASVLLVGHRRDDDIDVETEPGRLPARDQRCREARLHVIAAAAVQAVAVHAGDKRIGHRAEVNGVKMPAKQQRARGGPWSGLRCI